MKICVATGSRAEKGLLDILFDGLRRDEYFDCWWLDYRKALEERGGTTAQAIGRLMCDITSDSCCGLPKNNFDAVVVLGDRYESLAIAIAAQLSRIPIIHIHGGEATYGLYDEAFRHSITKMASLHFAATEQSRKRIIQLGENPATVFNVGALGCEGLTRFKGKPKEQLIVLFHPVTLGDESPVPLLKVLAKRPERKICVGSNADPNGRIHSEAMALTGWEFHDDLPRVEFLRILSQSKAIVGNSSAGIIEAPCLGVPTINVGDRQKGREQARTIINCLSTEESIAQAFLLLDAHDEWVDENPPYQGDNVSGKMVALIRSEFPKIKLQKEFYDLP